MIFTRSKIYCRHFLWPRYLVIQTCKLAPYGHQVHGNDFLASYVLSIIYRLFLSTQTGHPIKLIMHSKLMNNLCAKVVFCDAVDYLYIGELRDKSRVYL